MKPYQIESITYNHWGNADQFIDIESELNKIEETIHQFGEVVILAKSIGIILTLLGSHQKRFQPKSAVFFGSPIKTDQTEDYLALFDSAEFPILLIQQVSDPLTPYQTLHDILKQSKNTNFELRAIDGDDHLYDNYELISPTVGDWLDQQSLIS